VVVGEGLCALPLLFGVYFYLVIAPQAYFSWTSKKRKAVGRHDKLIVFAEIKHITSKRKDRCTEHLSFLYLSAF